MKKTLYLATENFPFENTEATFILPELNILHLYYNIVIISHAQKEVVEKGIKENDLIGKIKHFNINIELNIWKLVYNTLHFFFEVDGWKEVIEIIKSGNKIGMRIIHAIKFYMMAMEDYHLLKKKNIFDKEGDIIYYTFWNTYYTYSVTKNKEKYPRIKIISRIHGFDLYNERYKYGRQPFKKIIDVKLDKLIFACEYAKIYYINHFGATDSNKYIVSKIGTTVPEKIIYRTESPEFVLVSCSRVVPLKRIELIIDALSIWRGKKIEWHHIGGGERLEFIREYAKEKLSGNDFVVYIFHGNRTPKYVRDFYSKNRIDCFITTSESEGGAPLSIQEAMACGIPIIGTSVGGITEMIQGNGILLSRDPSPDEICRAFKEIMMLEMTDYIKMKECSKELWYREYQADINAAYMLEIIDNL